MRVGLVLERFEPCRGGLEQWTFQFAAELIRRGYEVHVVARQFSPAIARLSITPHRVPPVRSRLEFAEAARAILLPLALDVVHDMGAGWYCDIFHPHGGSWASVTERKLLLVPRWLRPLKRRLDPWLPRYREFQQLMARQYADRGQLLVALSQGVADDFRRFHQVASGQIRLIHNGVDTGHFSPERAAACRAAIRRQLGLDERSLLALIVAQNFRLKGLPTLLRALARLTARRLPIHGVVVGGKRLGPWRRFAARLGLQRTTTFVGPVDDPLPYYGAADCYVHPTLYDTCSLVVLEAAACGLPVVTTRYNGISELLANGVEGWIVADPTDAAELAERIATLLEPRLRLEMGAAARRLATQHTFQQNVDQILDLYDEVVRRRVPLASLPRAAGSAR
ncbi:MAG: glycosyltransferase family 4 protein [Thermoguttaceae bacterium]|jgi:UDP-glucose:(heptosyl)LPS alpha-1,3-glucosyltransferase